ncbi:MAG: hypothetical protein ACHQ50_13600 [Fimbriimonadales bacterium]
MFDVQLAIRRASLLSAMMVFAEGALAQVPSLDSLAGKWLVGDECVNPPSVTNTVGALGCSENLTGFRYCMFPPIAQGGEAATLFVDGKPVAAQRFRWFPYQAERSAVATNGLELLSTTRLGDNEPVVLIRLQVKNTASKPVTATFQLRNDTGFRRCPGVWDWSNRGVDPRDGFTHEMTRAAEVISDPKSGVVASITRLPVEALTFGPGESRTFEISLTLDPSGASKGVWVPGHARPLHYSVAGQALPLRDMFEQAKIGWESRWRDAFTPGNKRYSGNFPTLVSGNAKLNRMYYMALVTMLGMERTSYAHSRRCFVTVGPEYGTTLEYFWDIGLFSTIYTLLDPKVFKENLNAWLNVDIHSHYAIDYLTGKGVGPWYSPNDFSVFNSFWGYATTAGDTAFLDANRERLIGWAQAYESRIRPGEQLADFGDNDNILECAPGYVNMIPSLNAAHAGLMRRAAMLVPEERARAMKADAASLANAVLAQYVPGDGVWKTKHRDGNSVVCRHVYDYLTIGMWMTPDLTPSMRSEMTAFVDRELLADGWIRAMSLSDAAAAISDRPDHGPRGSYCAWPALAALTMAKFGQFVEMENLIELCEGASWQGPFPQAFELLQVPGTNRWIPRISLRGADYNETSGAAFAETIIHGLFGIEFGLHGEVQISQGHAPRPVEARLHNVRTKMGLRDFECGPSGVRIAQR